ncbi:MAG: FkbM family methyltransferase [Actinomycetota bacterium]|nr:FkbM family methyltransferase [Actinomycetota bacterium]
MMALRRWAQRPRRLLRAWLAVASLGASRTAAAKILAVNLVLLVRTRRRRGSGRRFRLELRYRGVRVRCVVSEYADLVVLREVFVEEQYALALVPPPSVIVDLGSNSGLSVLYFRIVHPQAHILAVEPDPAAFAKLEVNTRGWPGIVLRNVAVAARDGTRRFYTSAESWTSSLVPSHGWTSPDDVGPVDQRPIEIEARTLRSLMSEAGLERIDLLKLDVEGAEWEVLPQLGAIETLGAVLGELHWDVAGAPEGAVSELLAGFEVRVRTAHGRRSTIAAVRHRAARHTREAAR